MRLLELLSPARDADTAIAAIDHGADAVYLGAPAFGARAAAANTVADIARVVEYARPFGVRVYVALNTIIYKEELDAVRNMIEELWKIGVDALIVQDLGILGLDIPPIDLHASTQTDARSVEKIKMLAGAGFSQIVVPREFSLSEIKEAANALPDTVIEVFVHGALCVSYSGDCHAGALLMGRSANRGECPQICRLEFTLTDGDGNPLTDLPDGQPAVRHWLSTADMCRIESLEQLIDAGATSFKIEGRLKPVSYVKNTTLAYSRALDSIINRSQGKYRRSSFGEVEAGFTPDLSRTFNRGYTPYFLTAADTVRITSWRTPKWIGRKVGTLVSTSGTRLKINSDEPINNGDGLGFFDENGKFTGFRVNRSEGAYVYPAPGALLPKTPGTVLYRNSDSAHEAIMSRNDSARRKIGIEITLRKTSDGRVAADVRDERGCAITVATGLSFSDTARNDQTEQRKSTMERLGDTQYMLKSLTDLCGDIFVPAKALSALRRDAVAALDSAWRIRYSRRTRRASRLPKDILKGYRVSYHDNVSNPLAEKFYRSHGAETGEKAAEIRRPSDDVRVMTTRYCLRRELGACLKEKYSRRLPSKLFLKAPAGMLRLDFDCENCNMKVIIPENVKPK